jgi:hypothetical protein
MSPDGRLGSASGLRGRLPFCAASSAQATRSIGTGDDGPPQRGADSVTIRPMNAGAALSARANSIPLDTRVGFFSERSKMVR